MKLREFMEKSGLTEITFAKKVGLSPHTIIKYLSGARFPRKPVVLAIEKATKGAVAPNDWYH